MLKHLRACFFSNDESNLNSLFVVIFLAASSILSFFPGDVFSYATFDQHLSIRFKKGE